jgi:hypothetical protein
MRDHAPLGQISLGFSEGLLIVRGQGLVINGSILD